MQIVKKISGFNHYPVQSCSLIRPERYAELLRSYPLLTIRGQGRSYSDAALSEHGLVLLTERLNRFLEFDRKNGTVTAESGVTLAEILKVIVPAGWFLPVTPGTQYASLGGCVATDVHGKNHYHRGSFSHYIRWFELIDAQGEPRICSPDQNTELFYATVGGMGLTGIIGTISIQLIPLMTTQLGVTHFPASDIDSLFTCLSMVSRDATYCVAWIDLLAGYRHFGRGIVMSARHVTTAELPKKYRTSSPRMWQLPLQLPKNVLRSEWLRYCNQWYYQQLSKKQHTFFVDYHRYLYSLDRIANWNYLYGRRGFLQYQCVLPEAIASKGIQRILETVRASPYQAFLAVLKRFGVSSKGMLSFAMPGFTLALDFPLRDHGLFSLLNQLDEIVVQYQGRIYLAKDARLRPDTFRAMYPAYDEWFAIKQTIDPQNAFVSSLSRRLQI